MRDRRGTDRAVTAAFQVGTGPRKVIVSHGWIADSALFVPFAAVIDGSAFEFAFVDHQGYGRRRDEPGARSVEASAEDLLAVADGLGWDRFSVMGHSMGGMVAQWLMTYSEARLTSAVLLAAVPACGARLSDPVRAARLQATVDPATRRELIDSNTGRRHPPHWVDDQLALSLAAATPAVLAEYLSIWSDTDFAEAARGSRVRTLAITGATDPGITSELMRNTVAAWYPACTTVEMEGVGHYPMVEDPQDLWTVVRDFLYLDGYAGS